MRLWLLAGAAFLAGCGGRQATSRAPGRTFHPALRRTAPQSSAALAHSPERQPIVDPLAPLPAGAQSRCGTARLRFLTEPQLVSIDNGGRIFSLEKRDGELLLRDVVKGKTLRTLPDVDAATLSPDGTQLVTAQRGGQRGQATLVVTRIGGAEVGRVQLKLPAVTVRTHRHTHSVPMPIEKLDVTADGQRVLAFSTTTVFVVALAPPHLERTRKLPAGDIEAVSGDGSRVLVRKRVPGAIHLLGPVHQGVLELVDLHSGRTLRSFGSDKTPFQASGVALSRDGRRLFVGKLEGIDIVSAQTGARRKLARFPGLGGLGAATGRLLVAPDDSRLVFRALRGVFLVDTKSGRVEKLSGDTYPEAFSPDGRLVVYRDGRAAVVRGRDYDAPWGHHHPVTALAFFDGGQRLASVAGSLRVWVPATGAPVGKTPLKVWHAGLAASVDGRKLAIAGRELTIRQMHGAAAHLTSLHRLSAVAFAPDGDLIASTHQGGGYGSFGMQRGRPGLRPDRSLFRISPGGRTLASADAGDVLALAVTADSKRVAVAAHRSARQSDGVELFDTKALQRRTSLPELDGYVDALASAGPGRLVAASSAHGAVVLDLAKQKLTRRFALGHCCGVIAVSPDGKLLAAAADRDVQLWDIATRRLRGLFRGHTGDVQALAFSPDGKWLASAGLDTSVLVWNTAAAPAPPPAPAPAVDRPQSGSLSALARGRLGEHVAVLSHGRLVAPGEKLPKLPRGLLAVSRGPSASCAITAQRHVVCWGTTAGGVRGYQAKLGEPPRPVPGVSGARRIFVGLMYACAINAAGRLTCWGMLGGAVDEQKPAVLKLPRPVRDVAVGLAHACALLSDGHVLCWGDDPTGQLGIGGAPYARSPRPVHGISDATAIAVGQQHSCALRSTGAVLCWGDNRSDQLGDGTGIDRNAPVRVRGLASVRSISADESATCAVAGDGRVLCWGRLAGFRESEVHFLRPTVVDALGKASEVRVIAGHVCVEGHGPVRCARFRRRQ